MRRKHWALVLGLMGTMGCAATVRQGSVSHEQPMTLKLGMTQREAVAMLGSPRDIIGQDADGVLVETWKYSDRTLTFYNRMLQSWVDGTQASGEAGQKPAR